MPGHFSRVRLFVTLWTMVRQAPLFMGFSREEYCSGLPFPSLGIFLTQGSNPCLLYWQADSLPLSHLMTVEKCYFVVCRASLAHQ